MAAIAPEREREAFSPDEQNGHIPVEQQEEIRIPCRLVRIGMARFARIPDYSAPLYIDFKLDPKLRDEEVWR